MKKQLFLTSFLFAIYCLAILFGLNCWGCYDENKSNNEFRQCVLKFEK